MKLIVGLGNPGEKYKGTRHNVGREVVDGIEREVRGQRSEVRGQRGGWRLEKRLKSAICHVPRAIFAKPLVFMNESGRAIEKILRYYDTKILRDLWVIHDDIDLPLGRIKIQVGGSSAGHKGVQSIIDYLGREDFVRFRMGIGRPGEKLEVGGGIIESFVLSEFRPEEKPVVEEMVKRAVEMIQFGLEEGIEKAMASQFFKEK